MIVSVLGKNRPGRDVAAYTMVEIMVVVTIIIMIAAMLLGSLGRQSSRTKERVDYLQWRDDMVSAAQFHKWNYLKPSDPQAGRQIAELEFDASIRDGDLHNLW